MSNIFIMSIFHESSTYERICSCRYKNGSVILLVEVLQVDYFTTKSGIKLISVYNIFWSLENILPVLGKFIVFGLTSRKKVLP